jgi:hypothetical protein|tara:strand:+ start:285 stop:470 length:186 start_codon:yes stop_codon:yes gene_type:complete
MRQQEDGDIKPTKDAMEEAHKLISDILELDGVEGDEYIQGLENSKKELKKAIKRTSSQTGT